MSEGMPPADSPPAISTETVVHVVEDDLDLRDALACLLNSAGLSYRVFDAPAAFLDELPLTVGGCLVLDIRLPAMSGIELAKEVRRRCIQWPIVMMSAHADVPAAIQAFKLGALDFLIKPFESQQFLDVVQQALAQDLARRRNESQIVRLQSRLKQLTPKDWEVIEALRSGHPNKRIAARLGISERAVEMRRSNIFKKTQTAGLPALFELIAANSQNSWR